MYFVPVSLTPACAATIAAITGVLAENGITIRDGIFVSDDTYSPYDSEPGQDISTTEYSRVNAEFIYRGSTIEPTNRIVLPTPTGEADHATAVENRMNTIRAQAPHQAALQASELRTTMLERNDFPTDEDCVTLIANFQFPHIRDRLMADIPGINEPPQHILFAQTHTAPDWSRVEWAQQLLIHAYTRTSPQHSAPILTTIGYINWWEGRGCKAHQYLQLALDRPRLPLRQARRPNARSRHHRRLENQQKHRLQNQPRHVLNKGSGSRNAQPGSATTPINTAQCLTNRRPRGTGTPLRTVKTAC